ncbi:CopL family metal-binding regulatory protein [Colwellia sp. RSH04]|uniref:CopL family metal-binding regulatory protein n=1 Tax=Colwellia sp. RSH04 TaxID=2305464 RepID=UPI000E57C28F|nr:CopL family metal-binding regulatory protein [Colwellia sp. RSH04]
MLLLSLTFVGQGIAASLMSYQMIAVKVQSMEASQMPSHHGHMMSQQDQSMAMMTHDMSTSNDNCCSSDCQCITSGCFSVFAFSRLQTPSVILDITDKINQNTMLLPQQIMPSLFRPPIVS